MTTNPYTPGTMSDESQSLRQDSPPAAPPSAQRVHAIVWAAALGLVVVGAVLAGVLVPFGPGMEGTAVVAAILFAMTCLVAGWALRSWWGFIAVPVVYVAVAALMRNLFVASVSPELGVLTARFALDTVLPAFVMSAIGTAIGIGVYRMGRGGSGPRHRQLTA